MNKIFAAKINRTVIYSSQPMPAIKDMSDVCIVISGSNSFWRYVPSFDGSWSYKGSFPTEHAAEFPSE